MGGEKKAPPPPDELKSGLRLGCCLPANEADEGKMRSGVVNAWTEVLKGPFPKGDELCPAQNPLDDKVETSLDRLTLGRGEEGRAEEDDVEEGGASS